LNSQTDSNEPQSAALDDSVTEPAGAAAPRAASWARPVLAVLLVALAGGAWLYWSGKSGISPSLGKPWSAATDAGTGKSLKALSDEQLERMVAQATQQTEKEPKNTSAWAMLAHSYEMLGKFSEAVKAYTQLALLLPKDAQVLADYADVLAVSNGRSFKGEPFELLQRALALDPKNTKALVLAGSAYMEQDDAKQAVAFLERARATSTDPEFQRQIDASIAQAKAPAAPALSASAATAAASAPVGPTVSVGHVSGRVWLADSLQAKLPAQATLFVYARPVEGSRMPVALLRKKVSDLPLNFTLDDSMAMVANSGLSKFATVVVVARVSLRGNVTPQAGDLEGVSAPVAVGAKDLKLEITEVLK
jgi:cytochrome c-type biogenesis protein CcmH